MKPTHCLSMSVCGVLLLMAIPGAGIVAAGTPGDVNGSETSDAYWRANPGWCCVMEQDDVDEGEWWTGATFYQVYYRDNINDGWNGFIKEMTIPWVGIQMQGGAMIRYDHSQETSAYHLYFDGSSYTYHNYSQQQPWTSLSIDYDLDFDGDSTNEWKFIERIEFQPPAQGQSGFFLIQFRVAVFPTIQWQGQQVWGYNGTPVQTMDIPFIVDPDVYDNTQNQFYSGNVGNWNWENDEDSINAANNNIKIVNELPNPDVDIEIAANPQQGLVPASQTFFLLQFQGNEYASDPGDYDDDISLDNQDGLLWYVESYNVQNNAPPNVAGGTWTGVKCDGFVA